MNFKKQMDAYGYNLENDKYIIQVFYISNEFTGKNKIEYVHVTNKITGKWDSVKKLSSAKKYIEMGVI